MRQISDLSSTQKYNNASTSGFFARKGRYGRGSQNLPHTSVFVIPEVRGKSEICRPDLRITLPRPAVLLEKTGLCSAVPHFSPHFRKSGTSAAACDCEKCCTEYEKHLGHGNPMAVGSLGECRGHTARARLGLCRLRNGDIHKTTFM